MNSCRMEALVRWPLHPKRGYLSPDELISLAEDVGQIEPFGEMMFARGHLRNQ